MDEGIETENTTQCNGIIWFSVFISFYLFIYLLQGCYTVKKTEFKLIIDIVINLNNKGIINIFS